MNPRCATGCAEHHGGDQLSFARGHESVSRGELKMGITENLFTLEGDPRIRRGRFKGWLVHNFEDKRAVPETNNVLDRHLARPTYRRSAAAASETEMLSGGDERARGTSPRARGAARFEVGNLGDHKDVGAGVLEARLDFGPGYRVYFGRKGRELILLLLGGDKGSQKKDIKRAQEFWSRYLKENK